MEENKNHWYDGTFYDKLIAPHQESAFSIVKSTIPEGSSILDVGCGTGRLAFQLENRFSKYDGIDLSRRNIESANKNLSKNPSKKISFRHIDIQKFLKAKVRSYDFAVASYVIHEVDGSERENILRALAEAADKIILVDYLYPQPTGFCSVLNEVIEFAAGVNHYKNFKSYLKGEGIYGLAESTRLKIITEIKDTPPASHIVVLSK